MPRRPGIVRLVRLGLLGLLGLLIATLAGCGDDDADRSKVGVVEQQALDAVDGVLHRIAERADMEFEAGHRSAAICGESYAPRGVNLRVLARLGSPAELTHDAAMAVAEDLLADDGWEVDPTRREHVVLATRDELEMRLDFTGPVQVSLTAGCIETGGDLAREIADRPSQDLAWGPGRAR